VTREISVGSFVSFIAAMMLLMQPLKHLTNINASIQRGVSAARSIFEVLDEPTEPDQGRLPLSRARGAIEFRNVSFAYDPDKGDVLRDISFSIEPGQTVALVGRSGSGKTTLAHLLVRFYDPVQGAVCLDGEDIRDYRLADLRRQIAMVGQDVMLFNETIAHNIAYGRFAAASEADIIASAQAAHAMEFIEALPDGLATRIGDRGILLSGGQRQRIAIARAMLKDAPVLILDEATSSLDSESERAVQDALEHLARSRTSLIIAHRLSTVERADFILLSKPEPMKRCWPGAASTTSCTSCSSGKAVPHEARSVGTAPAAVVVREREAGRLAAAAQRGVLCAGTAAPRGLPRRAAGLPAPGCAGDRGRQYHRRRYRQDPPGAGSGAPAA